MEMECHFDFKLVRKPKHRKIVIFLDEEDN